MKPVLHPHDTDFKTTELFACEKGIGLRVLCGGQPAHMTPDQWEKFKADGDAFVKEHLIRQAAQN